MKIIEVITEPRKYKIGAIVNDNDKLIAVPFVVCDRNLKRVDAKCYETAAMAMEAGDDYVELVK